MEEQQAQGNLLDADQLAEYSRLEAQANAKTSKTKTALDTLATTQQASSWPCTPQAAAQPTGLCMCILQPCIVHRYLCQPLAVSMFRSQYIMF